MKKPTVWKVREEITSFEQNKDRNQIRSNLLTAIGHTYQPEKKARVPLPEERLDFAQLVGMLMQNAPCIPAWRDGASSKSERVQREKRGIERERDGWCCYSGE